MCRLRGSALTVRMPIPLWMVALLTASLCSACGSAKAVLNEQAEAHRLASQVRVNFTRAADASNRAVMADTDEASGAAAHEAQQATQSVQHDVDALKTVLGD